MTNYYKGISFPFRFGSNGGVTQTELTPTDFDRIRESLWQIIFTYKNERIFLNYFGSRIKEYLFEPADDINTLALIKFEVEKSIEENEERVELLDVRVYTVDAEEGKIYIDIEAKIIQFSKVAVFQYVIDRDKIL